MQYELQQDDKMRLAARVDTGFNLNCIDADTGDSSFGSWDYRMTVSQPDWRFTVPAASQ